MKTLVTLLLGLATAAVGHAQPLVLHEVGISNFGRDGRLTWTNRLCTIRPVYEVLWASSPTGPWARLALLTNQTFFATPNPATAGPGSRFYQVRWVDDAPWNLSYAYDEGLGLGCPAAVGSLSLTFWRFPQAGTGVFFETECSLFEEHPVGTKNLTGLWYAPDRLALLLESGPDYLVWLEGTVQRTSPTAPCAFTRYAGIVWAELFGVTGPIGTFEAVPAP